MAAPEQEHRFNLVCEGGAVQGTDRAGRRPDIAVELQKAAVA